MFAQVSVPRNKDSSGSRTSDDDSLHVTGLVGVYTRYNNLRQRPEATVFVADRD